MEPFCYAQSTHLAPQNRKLLANAVLAMRTRPLTSAWQADYDIGTPLV